MRKTANIIEQGNHAELLAKGSAYAALYNSQFETVEIFYNFVGTIVLSVLAPSYLRI